MSNDFKNFPLSAVKRCRTKANGVFTGGILDGRIDADTGVITLECAQKTGMCVIEFVDIELKPNSASWEWQGDNIVITFMQAVNGATPPPLTIMNVNRPLVENL